MKKENIMIIIANIIIIIGIFFQGINLYTSLTIGGREMSILPIFIDLISLIIIVIIGIIFYLFFKKKKGNIKSRLKVLIIFISTLNYYLKSNISYHTEPLPPGWVH